MGLNRLGIALLALSACAAWEVSATAQLDSQPPVRSRPPAIRSAEVVQPQGVISVSGAWKPVGPSQILSPSFGLMTGRVTSLAIDPSDTSGNTVYVGTTGGGVWKSTNAAASASQVVFTPLTDAVPEFSPGHLAVASLSIGALSVQPGGTGVVLAGTGDPNNAYDSYYGSGLLRSTDNGVTWALIQQSDDSLYGPTSNFMFNGEAFAGFAWGTTSSNFVVAAIAEAAEGTIVDAPTYGLGGSVRGLYYSSDAGATWRLATITDGPYKPVQGPGKVGWVGSSATAVVWNPIRKKFYAALQYHGYYDSPDGITFTRLVNQPGLQLTANNCPITPGYSYSNSCPVFRGALAVQPVSGDLFAITVDPFGKNLGLWQDVCNLQSGACASPTVTFAHQVQTGALETSDGSHTLAHGTYNLWLAAVPSQADTVLYTGTVDISRCSLSNGCVWRNTTNSTTCRAGRVAPSQHAMDLLPGPPGQAFAGLMYFGNDGGLWRTTSGVQQASPACSASDAQAFDNLNGGIGSLAEIAGLAQNPTDSSIYLAGLASIGFAAPAPGQAAWPQVLEGAAGSTAIDPVNPQYWYTSSWPSVSIRRCSLGQACTPADFNLAIGAAQTGGDGIAMQAPAPFVLDPKDPSQMLVGTCRVWLGPASGGASWSSANAISPMLDGVRQPSCNNNAFIRSLAVSPDATGEWLYAGMAGRMDGGGKVAGHVFRARRSSGMTTWTDLSSSPVTNSQEPFNPGHFAISSLVADLHDATGQTVYVIVDGFASNGSVPLIYQTKDGGAHWANVNNNLSHAPANGMVIDPQNAETVYMAVDSGVFVTRQISGCSNTLIHCWSPFGTGLPNAPVTQLLAFGSGTAAVLRAGTYGRGIWEIPLASQQSTGTTATIAPAAVAFPDQPVQTPSVAQSLVLTNSGTQPLEITQLTLAGDFTEQDTCAAAILPQGTCSISVTFLPTLLGTGTGLLTVMANIPTGQLTVALTGNGIKGSNVMLLPGALDFGTVITGSLSAMQYLTISNMGGSTIALGAMGVSGAYRLSVNTCGASLAPTYGCTVGINFAPITSGLAPGSFSVSDDAGTQTAALIGTGATPASENLAPSALTFPGQLQASNSAPQPVTLTNDGDSSLLLIRALVTGDFSLINNCGASLSGHTSCALSVIFHPSRAGLETGTLTVSDLISTHTVALSGTGLAPAGVSIAPTSLDFGGVGVGGNSAQSVTLTNNGGVSLDGIAFTISGDFALAANGCTSSLAAGASCVFQVVFSPVEAGPRAGDFFATSSSGPSFHDSLTGYGEDFALVVSGTGSATVVTGQVANFALSLVPIAGSSGTVSLACTGAPTNSICTVSPVSVQVTGGNTVSVSVQVATGVVAPRASSRPAAARSVTLGNATKGFLALALLLPMGWSGRRFRPAAALVLLCLALATWGCGVSVSGGKPSAPPHPVSANATPAGTYLLTITATTPGIQRTATLSLTVE